jgi:hypothetical protein
MNDTELELVDSQQAGTCPWCGQALPDPHPLDHVEKE